MTILDHQSYSIGAGRPLGWVARVANIAAGIMRMVRNRQALRQLSELTDCELSDIGLTRADLRDAFDSPFCPEPTTRLSQVAAQRAIEQMARRVA